MYDGEEYVCRLLQSAQAGHIPTEVYAVHTGTEADLIALKLNDTRDFMKKLLIENVFDSFQLSEASVTTFTTFHIDGTWHPDFFEDDPPAALNWNLVKPILFGIIKGSRTPNHFRIVLKLDTPGAQALLKMAGAENAAVLTDALFLNLTYTGDTLTCTSGISMKQFTMDKTADRLWDEAVRRFFQKHQISFELLS